MSEIAASDHLNHSSPDTAKQSAASDVDAAKLNQALTQRMQELQLQETSFCQFLAQSQDAVLIVNQQGWTQFANTAAAALLARPIEELLQQPCPLTLEGGATRTVELPGERTPPVIATLQVFETLWQGESAVLVLLQPLLQKTAPALAAAPNAGSVQQVQNGIAEFSHGHQEADQAIQDRQQLEAALRAAELRLNDILNSITAVVTCLRLWRDRTWTYEYVSAGCERVYGYSAQELMADPSLWQSRVLAEDWERNVLPTFTHFFAEARGTAEYRFRHRDESLRWLSQNYSSRYDAATDCWIVTIATSDISEQKRMEAERQRAETSLRASQELYALATTESLVGVWDWHLKTDELYLSPNLKAMLGYAEAEIPNQMAAWSSLIHPDDRVVVEELAQLHLEGSTPVFVIPHRRLHKDGSVRWMLTRGMAFWDEKGNPYRMAGTETDITQLKQAEQALQQRVALEQLITSISTQFINLDADEIDAGIQRALQQIGEFAEVDRSYLLLLSEDGQQFSNNHQWCATNIADQVNHLQGLSVATFPWAMQKLQRFEVLQVPQVADLPLEASAEQAAWIVEGIQSILYVPMVSRGKLLGCVGFDAVRRSINWTTLNINLLRLVGEIFVSALERKQTETQLKQMRLFLDSIIENIPNMIFVKDAQDFRFVRINRAAEELLGYNRTELLGKCSADFCPPDEVDCLTNTDRAVVTSQQALDIPQETIQTRSGIRYLQTKKIPLRDTTGQVEYLLAISEDITDRRRAEERLRLLESVVVNTNDAVVIAEVRPNAQLDPRIVYVNDAFTRTTGYSLEEVYGQSPRLLQGPKTDRTQLGQIRVALATWQPVRAELINYRKDGSEFWVELTISPVADSTGRYTHWVSIQREVGDRKRAEIALQESEERFRQLAENIEGVFWMTDRDQQQLLYISPTYEKIWGMACLSRSMWLDSIHPDDRDRTVDLFYRSGGEYAQEYRIMRADGKVRWVRDRAFPIRNADGEIYRIAGLAEDITEQKQIETALQRSEEWFRLLSASSPIGIFYIDGEGRCLYTNPRWQEMASLTLEESLGDGWLKAIHPEDQGSVLAEWESCAQQRREFSLEYRFLTAQGETRWVRSRAAVIHSKTGEMLGYVGTNEDITDRKQAEAVLRKLNEELELKVRERTQALSRANVQLLSEIGERKWAEEALQQARDQLQAVLDAVPGCIAWIGSDLKYRGVNRYMAATFNLQPEAFIGQDIGFLKQGTPGFAAFMHRFFTESNGKSSQLTAELEIEVDNSTKSYLVIAQNYLQGQAAVFVGIDITERKLAEAEIYNALAKEKELGELKSRFISMASHEFRTPLSTILISSEMLEHYGHKWTEEKKRTYHQQIQIAAKRMTQLLDDVLIISADEAGKLKLNPTPLDLVKFCRDLVTEMQLGLGTQHTLTFTSQSDTKQACLDEKLLRQILCNLLSNAIKYSPDGGLIHLELSYQAGKAIFQIQDSGIGIPPEDQQHLFELFHRAKNVKTIPGTGLGLAIVKRSVDLHGGVISVESQVGLGTKFTVKLPLNS